MWINRTGWKCITNLLPAIVEKWPAWEERVVHIQLNNAPVHPQPGRLGKQLTQHLSQLWDEAGWDINFVTQPVNLPNMNTLDLAFFLQFSHSSIKKRAQNLNDLIANVEEAYTKLPLDVCRHVWSTAQIVINSILLSDGGNQYKLPHIGKMWITRALGNKQLPMRLPCQAIIAGANIDEATITLSSPPRKQTVSSCVYFLHHHSTFTVSTILLIVALLPLQ